MQQVFARACAALAPSLLCAYIGSSTGCSTPKSQLVVVPERDASMQPEGGDTRDAATFEPRTLNAPCQPASDAPCNTGLSCVAGLDGQAGRCRQTCEKSEECASGCCTQAEGLAASFCDSVKACTCARIDTPCGASGQGDCCFGLVCIRAAAGDSGVSTAGLTGCKQPCERHKDCASKCCVPFGGQSGGGVCGPSELCE